MLNAIYGVMLYAHTYTWSEALYSLNAIQEGIFMLIAIHGMKLCTQCYT